MYNAQISALVHCIFPDATVLADIGAGRPLGDRGIATSLVVFVLAVQLLCDTAAFLAAFMSAGRRLLFLRLRRGGRIAGHTFSLRSFRSFLRVALRAVFMDALSHEGITVLGVLVAAGRPIAALGVAALRRMLRVVFTQAARLCALGKGRLRAKGEQHSTAEKQA